MRNLALAFCALGLVACSSLHADLPVELVYSLPRDERITIYDAENDVVISRSREDDAKLEIAKLHRDLDALSDLWDRAKDRLEKAHADRVGKARDMYDAKRRYLKESLDVAEAGLETAEAQTSAANTRLELARARQLVRLGLLGESKVKAFEDAAESVDKKAKAAERSEVSKHVDSQKSFTAWKDAEDAYARATGDFDSLVWVD
jgi:hypothetical protein